MQPSFNLMDLPWIPCVLKAEAGGAGNVGRVIELSLRATLRQAHRLQGLHGGSPLVTAALYRLLLAVLHSALRGPRTRREWAAWWQAGSWDYAEVEDYCTRWAWRFELFDPVHPFYQAADARVKPKAVINLIPEMAAGNNATLFDHHTEATGATLSPAEAARAVVALQTFGLGGLCDTSQGLLFTDAPCARGITFLLEGESLFETLALNLVRYTEDEPLPGGPEDRPAWELEDPRWPAREIPLGYLDYLTWQSRRVQLFPEPDGSVRQATLAPGLRLDPAVLDPFKHYRKDPARGFLVQRFSEDRVHWRDSAALFQLQARDHARPPENIRWVARLVQHGVLDPWRQYRLLALGMANNQAKVEFMRQEQLPLPLTYLENDQHVSQFSTALEWADAASRALGTALSVLAVIVVSARSAGKDWQEIDRATREEAGRLRAHWGVERTYWGVLELPFLALVESIPHDPDEALSEWRRVLARAAWQAIGQAEALAGTSPAALKAAVQARGRLALGLAQIFP